MKIYSFLIRLALSLFLFFVVNLVQAQEQIGLRVENYSGIGSVILNPSWQSTNPLAWDLNLVEAGQFVDNNYAYLENTNLIHTLKNTDNIRGVFEETNSGNNEDEIILDFYDSNRKKYLSNFTEIMGPSLSVRIRDENYIGFFIKARIGTSIQRIPSELGYYDIDRLPNSSTLVVDKIQVAAMSWSEFGLNYARKIETYDGHIAVGANVKFLTGYEAAYVKNNISFAVQQESGDTIAVDSPNIAFGFTNSNVDVADGQTFRRSRNGNGFGFDIGATYVYEGNEDNYKLKIGLSFIDIGRINFRRNTGDYLLSYDSIQLVSPDQYNGFDNLDSLVNQASINFYDDIEELRRGNDFKMGLPSAFSLQADYMVLPMFYVNGLLVQRLTMGNNIAVERGNLLAITPRFEHRWGAVNLPFVWYNYQHFNVGLSIRLAFLTLGTDNLGSLLGKQSKFTGTDFYVGLKINPFDIGWNLGLGGGGKGNVKCYGF